MLIGVSKWKPSHNLVLFAEKNYLGWSSRCNLKCWVGLKSWERVGIKLNLPDESLLKFKVSKKSCHLNLCFWLNFSSSLYWGLTFAVLNFPASYYSSFHTLCLVTCSSCIKSGDCWSVLDSGLLCQKNAKNMT